MIIGHLGGRKSPKLVFKKNKGTKITKLLWPEIELEPKGSFWDMYGIDAHLNGQTVQIKYDQRIATSGNIYHEFYEKSANHPEQPWRKSPGIADHYIFTTDTGKEIVGYLISVDTLAKAEISKKLESITPNNEAETSIGILLPLDVLRVTIKRQVK